MKSKLFLTPFIFFSLTLLGIEFSSLMIVKHPLTTSWRKIHKNGLVSNIENRSAIHEYWGDRKIKYAFGKFANRISLNKNRNKDIDNRLSQKNSCNYLIIGDSSSFGWLVDYEKIYSKIIENHFNKKFNNRVVFVNASAGGWGIADYPAYLEIYKKKLKALKLKGIIVMVNFDDARRAAISNLYEIKNTGDIISVSRTNKYYYSQSGKTKRFLSNKFVTPIYDFLQIHLNSARVIKNFLVKGRIEKDPIKTNKEWSFKKAHQRYLNAREKLISSEDKAVVKRAYLDLSASASNLAPLYLVHSGFLPLDKMSPINQYFFSQKGQKFLSENKIMFDFTTIGNKVFLSDFDLIKFDGHPTEQGHLKIAENIINSKSETSINNFLEATCTVDPIEVNL